MTKKDALNLGLICDLLKEKKILDKPLHDNIDVVRKLRNSQHIGPDKSVKSFSKKDLENAFSVASEVKNFVSTRIK